MMTPAYLQPVAYHRDYAYRLLLTSEDGTWFLWHGDHSGLQEIDRTLAQWIYQRPEIYPMPGPVMWFEASALPVADPGVHTILGD